MTEMKLHARAHRQPLTVVVEEDALVGFYLYIFEDGNEVAVKDYLYESLDDLFEVVEEDYGVKKEDWINGVRIGLR